jgi:hypothetical protein
MPQNIKTVAPSQAFRIMKRIATANVQGSSLDGAETTKPWRPTVMLHGEPGSGKTALVRRLSQELFGKEPIILHPALNEATDFKGMFDLDRDFGVTRWLRPEFLPCEGKGVIFFDEISQARRDVMAALYPFLYDRAIHGYKVPDDYIIVAAGNDIDDGAIANSMGTALNDRVIHLNVAVTPQAFIDHQIERGCHPAILALIQQMPHLLTDNKGRIEKDLTASPTSRGWEEASRLLSLFLPDVRVVTRTDAGSREQTSDAAAAVAGRVGEEAQEQLFATIRDMNECANALDIMRMDGRTIAKNLPKTLRAAFALAYGLVALVDSPQAALKAVSVLTVFRAKGAAQLSPAEVAAAGIEQIARRIEAKGWSDQILAMNMPERDDLLAYLEHVDSRRHLLAA